MVAVGATAEGKHMNENEALKVSKGDGTESMKITLEGFVDYRGEYDMGVYIVKPVVSAWDAYNLDTVIEDYCIDASLGQEPEDEDDPDVRRQIQNCFYRARKKSTEMIRYWKVTVEVYPYDDKLTNLYDILEAYGEAAASKRKRV